MFLRKLFLAFFSSAFKLYKFRQGILNLLALQSLIGWELKFVGFVEKLLRDFNGQMILWMITILIISGIVHILSDALRRWVGKGEWGGQRFMEIRNSLEQGKWRNRERNVIVTISN